MYRPRRRKSAALSTRPLPRYEEDVSTEKHVAHDGTYGNSGHIKWRLMLAIIWLITVYGSFLRHSIRRFVEKLGI